MNGPAAATRIHAALATYGEAMVLKRRTVTAGALAAFPVMGTQRSYQPSELTGQLQQGDSEVLLSTVGETPRKGDILVIQNRAHVVQAAEVVRLSGVSVCHRLWVRGG